MTVIFSLYGIIMDHEINAPGHGNNVFDVLFEGEMRLLGKLASNDTSKIWKYNGGIF